MYDAFLPPEWLRAQKAKKKYRSLFILLTLMLFQTCMNFFFSAEHNRRYFLTIQLIARSMEVNGANQLFANSKLA